MGTKQAESLLFQNPACFSRLGLLDPDLESGATFISLLNRCRWLKVHCGFHSGARQGARCKRGGRLHYLPLLTFTVHAEVLLKEVDREFRNRRERDSHALVPPAFAPSSWGDTAAFSL